MGKSTSYLIERLEALLAEGFSAQGSGLEAKVLSVGRELPDDLLESLHNLARENIEQGKDEASSLEFAFHCGQVHERLATLAQNQLAANIAFLAPDGTPPLELEKNDLDAIARFVVMRDRFLKIVADYTLKFLLVAVILLVIGLSLGLI